MMRSIDFLEQGAEVYNVRLLLGDLRLGFCFRRSFGKFGFAQPYSRNGRVDSGTQASRVRCEITEIKQV
jgi:hypothetical protein